MSPFILFALLIVPAALATNPVQIMQKNGQLGTSTTLKWERFSVDERQQEFSVVAGHFVVDADNKYPMYVCRWKIDGFMTIGHTMKHSGDKWACVLSMHSNVRTHYVFDVLVNYAHAAKLTWRPWRTFEALTPEGAVSAVTSSSSGEVPYVARRKVELAEHNQHAGADYLVGRMDCSQVMGKIYVVKENEEMNFPDGLLLIESIPTHYHLTKIHFDNSNKLTKRNETILGTTTLTNDGSDTNLVETVMSYEFDQEQYWGQLEGVLTGSLVTVIEKGKSPVQHTWGLKDSKKKINTKAVRSNLQPGTALNVTIRGFYTREEKPYKGKLISFYEVNNETSSRNVESVYMFADMLDVKFEFSDIYWTHNQTLVPTTTTTTTTSSTTSTSTTPATTTQQKEAKPVYSPPIEDEDTMDNDIDAEESQESVTEDKYKMSNLDAAATASASSQLTSSILLAIIYSIVANVRHIV